MRAFGATQDADKAADSLVSLLETLACLRINDETLTIVHDPLQHPSAPFSAGSASIRHPLLCARCRYDLLGLDARGSCPECGTAIVDSLAARLDLDSDSFLPIHGIKRVAATIFVAALGLLGGACVFLALVVQFTAVGLESPTLHHFVFPLRALAMCATALGIAGFTALLPWVRQKSFTRAHILGAGGFAMWFAAASVAPSMLAATYTALPAAMVLLAIGPLLRDLGPRSRAYRNAHLTAQRIDGLLLSIGLAGGSGATAEFLEATSNSENIAGVLRLIAAAGAGLSTVGFAYLLVNAAWILRATFRPMLTVEQAFGADQTAPRSTLRP